MTILLISFDQSYPLPNLVFLEKQSGISQLLTCYSEIIEAFESGLSADIACLDLKKAFDSVPHNELLVKLWRIGITEPLWL